MFVIQGKRTLCALDLYADICPNESNLRIDRLIVFVYAYFFDVVTGVGTDITQITDSIPSFASLIAEWRTDCYQ